MKLYIVKKLPEENEKRQDGTYILSSQIDEIPNEVFTNVELNDILDYISIEERPVFLTKTINKLRNNGSLSLMGYDIVEISKKIITGSITIDEANHILYDRKSCDNLFRMLAMLRQFNMFITDKRLSSLVYFIQGTKN